MGIFDIFTGDSAKEAAAQNSDRLNQFKAEGLGYLNAGKSGAVGALDNAKGYFDPLKDLSAKYGAGTNLYLDSLGVNGAEGTGRATGAFQTGPGYNFAVNSSLDALDRRASSRGMLASGNTTNDTLSTVNGLANQEYGNWQNRLAGLVSPELAATGTTATGLAGLEAGKAPIYVNDANQRVALSSGVTSGLNNQTTQSANAEMAGSGNLWGLGLSLASMAMGMPPMGGNLLGGGANKGNAGGTGGGLGGLY